MRHISTSTGAINAEIWKKKEKIEIKNNRIGLSICKWIKYYILDTRHISSCSGASHAEIPKKTINQENEINNKKINSYSCQNS